MESLHNKKIKLAGLILIGLFSVHNIWGQNSHTLSLNYGFGGNMMLVDGFNKEKGFSNDGMYSIGIRYQKNISERIALKTGLDYSRNNVLVAAGYHPYLPEDGESSWDINLLSLPIYINYQPLDFLFIEAGPIIDLQFNIWDSQPTDTQSGIGLALGIGGIYTYKNLCFTLGPFANYHAILQFEPYDRDRLLEMGVKFGIGFNF